MDWDWWLALDAQHKLRHVVVPEVSRVRHEGSAGAHVTGWYQSLYHDDRLVTTQYDTFLMNVGRSGHVAP